MSDGRAAVEPLWREAMGRRLRDIRRRQRRTLAETARHAGISTQYLSELERGRKDASSEVIAAISGALGYSLGEVAWMAAADLLASAGLTPAGRPVSLARSRLVRPIGTRLSHAQVGRLSVHRPMGPVALAA
jgi:transcriptional regulator with XRE-family HTH domain